MDLAAVITQLRGYSSAFGAGASARIAGAAAFEEGVQDNANLRLPAAYVLPLEETAGEPESLNGYRQAVESRFAVLVAIDNRADQRGQAAADQVADLRAAIFAAILNWQPFGDQGGEVQYQGGRFLAMDRARFWWQFEFTVVEELDASDGYSETRPWLEGVDIDVDAIDPAFDANTVPIGPDGRVEHVVTIDLPTGDRRVTQSGEPRVTSAGDQRVVS